MTMRTTERKTKTKNSDETYRSYIFQDLSQWLWLRCWRVHSLFFKHHIFVGSFVRCTFVFCLAIAIFRHEEEEETAAAKRSLLSTAQWEHKHKHTSPPPPPTQHTPRKRIVNGDGGSMVDVLCHYRSYSYRYSSVHKCWVSALPFHCRRHYRRTPTLLSPCTHIFSSLFRAYSARFVVCLRGDAHFVSYAVILDRRGHGKAEK